MQKRKFLSPSFRQTKLGGGIPDAVQHRRERPLACRRNGRALRPALRGAVLHRAQRFGAAAPAAVLGLLERERFFDRETIADRNVFAIPCAAGRGRLRLSTLEIPAGTGTVRRD